MATNPPLQGEILRETQFELVSSTTSAGTLYGIAFVLYCLYLHASLALPLDHSRRRQAQFMITYSTIIMICGLYFLISNAWIIQDAYIKHSNFPGGPLEYENSLFHTQPVIAIGTVCETAVDILTAAIQIWRLWVVWSGTRYARLVVVLPLLSLLGFTALEITLIVFAITLNHKSYTETQAINIATAEFALHATAVIFPTVIIAGFLAFENQRHRKLMGKLQAPNLYISVIAMLVESYALESAWIIALVILQYSRDTVYQFFGDTLLYIEIIAYLLVLYRVANGRSYGSKGVPEPSSRRDNMSSLHWNHTTTQSGVTNEVDTNTDSSGNKPEPHTLQALGSPA